MTILFTEKSKKFILTTASTAYCFGIDCEANLQHLYWGKKLPWEEDYPDCREIGQAVGIGKNLENPRNLSISDFYYPYEAGKAVINEEYVGWGGLNFVEPCLKLTYPDGVRDLRLKYSTHQFIQEVQPEYSTLKEEHHQHPSAVYRQPSDITSVPDLVVTLKDDHYPLFVHLCYRVLEDFDLILRWAEIENHCLESVWLESAQSVVWHVPDSRTYRLTYLAGRWSNEFNLKQVVMEQGKKVMESRRGIPGHHETPWFALDPEGASTEHTGQVWFGALAWSGNWKMMVERTSNGQTRITAGIHDFDFAWEVKPGEVYRTPESVGGYSEAGFGGGSRLLHRYGLHCVYPENHRGKPWPVFYNTWETFWFDFDEQKLLALAERAAQLGVEVFHVDDGWFGTRQNEYSGLGDWFVNKSKFPNGLKPLVEKVHSLGMDFSLWIEPENVNVNSDLYRAHPDWVYGFPTRPPTIQRESLILNLGKEQVREYLWERLSYLVREAQVKHFKWDMNRHMSEPGWGGLPAQAQKELWVRHVQGVYELMRRIKTEFPQVTLECCSGGGGRVDYGILKYCEIALTSDNHDPLARLLIQEGCSYVYPAKTMGSWVTDVPSPLTRRSLPLKFMFHMAMIGAMGIQSNILEWNDQECEYAREMIRLYKEIRPIIQEGDLYRLNSLRKDHISAVQYVHPAAGRSVIFALMWTNLAKDLPQTNLIHWANPRFCYTLYPRGLAPEMGYLIKGRPGMRSGESLMSAGIAIELEGDGDSLLIRLDAVKRS